MESITTQTASFTLLRTYYDAYRKMGDRAKLEYMEAIMSFGFEGAEPAFTEPMADLAFTLIRPTLENSVQYHTAQRENGIKGGRPKKNAAEKKPTETQEKPNENPNETQTKPNDNQTETQKKRECDSESESDNDSDNENESDSDLSAAKRQFIAPQAQKILREEDPLKDFELLWRAYPRKEDREAALAAFLKTNLPSSMLIPVAEAQKEFFARKKHPYIPKLDAWLELKMYSGTDCVGGKNERRHRPRS